MLGFCLFVFDLRVFVCRTYLFGLFVGLLLFCWLCFVVGACFWVWLFGCGFKGWLYLFYCCCVLVGII